MSVAGSSTTAGRVKALGVALALLAVAVLLASFVPLVQEVRLAPGCSRLGGALDRSTENVEPLVVGRTVFRCVGPGGQVLKSW